MKKTTISTDAAVIIKPPRRIILGKKTRGRLTDLDIFGDFLEAFCHVAIERCSPPPPPPSSSDADDAAWQTAGKFGADYEFRKCARPETIRHVAESCQLAKQYLTARRLYAFEVSMITPSETQLLGFRITVSQLEYAPERERVRKIYATLSAILENVRTMELPELTDAQMFSTKYRPRVRLLTRLRPESLRKPDPSSAACHVSIPLANSVFLAPNFFNFYAHM
ncbi:unnamed protein product [Caenorhabditis sp. 36 PRJEB53466]|nr:unnamed protein product [Caenorhabditis sp. 36 PRJEB53466]